MEIEKPDAIDATLHDAVDRGQVAGVVAAVANRDGVVYRGAFGSADRGSGTEMRADSIFRIASMTKALTSVAVMQLVERGCVTLDEPARTYLPQLADLAVLDGSASDGSQRLRPPATPPTVRELLTHTSGFAYEMWCEPIARLQRSGNGPEPDASDTQTPLTQTQTPLTQTPLTQTPLTQTPLTQTPLTQTPLQSIFVGGAGFLDAPLVFDPGTRWQYGIGTDWLGRLVEQVSDSTLERYLSQHIFEPLGMTDSGFVPAQAQLERLVSVHHRDADGELVPIPAAVENKGDFYSGGGGLVSTADDYLTFLRALLGGGSIGRASILSSTSVEQMTRNQIGALLVERLASTDLKTSADIDFFPGVAKSWGLGFLINEGSLAGGRAAGSFGWAGLFNSYYWVDPTSGLCAVLLAQHLPFFDAPAVALLDRFERSIYAARSPAVN